MENGVPPEKNSLYKKLLPLGTLLLTASGIYASSDSKPAGLIALSLATVLGVLWLLETKLGGYLKNLASRKPTLFPEQETRLSTLLDDLVEHTSDTHTHSPFYVWRMYSSKLPEGNTANYHHYSCLLALTNNLKAKSVNPKLNKLLFLDTISIAMVEFNRLAEYVETGLEQLINSEKLTATERKRAIKEWDMAKSKFNHWNNKWSDLFKEINKSHDLNCVEYFRPLRMVG